MKIRIRALDHLVLTVVDIDASAAFYRDALGMEAIAFQTPDGSTRTALQFGDQKINLHTAESPFKPHAAQPQPGSADLCLLTDTPLSACLTHLRDLGVAVEAGPVARTGATGPLVSIYLRDPDGNLIEISNQVPA